VVIHGATGGVGIAAVQWSRAKGLTTIGTYGSADGRALLERLGAGTADHSRADHVATMVGDGVAADLVIEMLANVNLEHDLDLLGPRGRVVVVGSRGTIEITPRKLMGRDSDIRGMSLVNATHDELDEVYREVDAALTAGTIRPVIQKRYPLADAAQAHRDVMERPSHGKIVLLP
jgi:NADPH2:quinone reductase